MNNFDDWLDLFGIKSPLKYLENKSIMTQVGITKSVDFAKPKRKKATLFSRSSTTDLDHKKHPLQTNS